MFCQKSNFQGLRWHLEIGVFLFAYSVFSGCFQRIFTLGATWRTNSCSKVAKAFKTLARCGQLLADFSAEMSDSGALLRNAMRWDLPVDDTAGLEISSFAGTHMAAVDQAAQMLLTEDAPSFLRPDWSIEEGVYPPIFPEAGE